METVYGLLSDADRRASRGVVGEYLDHFRDRCVHAVVLWGEVGSHLKNIAAWAKTKHKELFAIPGSHESLSWLHEIGFLQQAYPGIHLDIRS